MNAFYEGPNAWANFESVLTHWLAVFSEGSVPIVPVMGTVAATFEAPCYRDFPASEKSRWLEANPVRGSLSGGAGADARG